PAPKSTRTTTPVRRPATLAPWWATTRGAYSSLTSPRSTTSTADRWPYQCIVLAFSRLRCDSDQTLPILCVVLVAVRMAACGWLRGGGPCGRRHGRPDAGAAAA